MGYGHGSRPELTTPASLLDRLGELTDPRDRRGRRYPLVPLLGLCLVGIRAGHPALAAISDIITVRPDDRVLQILAGPGSGKTEVLVWRVLYDLCVLGTPSERVMVTTFTGSRIPHDG
ncbi:MAG TPA: UvrD-helicase domain-containing protein [Urbifossiella sp.]|nr:UvrD-helicase domain-containing protein [Urbifossiella sp.]